MNESVKAHNILMNDRKTLSVTGISELIAFDENTVCVDVSGTELCIGGTSLSVTRLSLETGEIDISGTIDSLVYSVTPQKGRSFVSRLLGRE